MLNLNEQQKIMLERALSHNCGVTTFGGLAGTEEDEFYQLEDVDCDLFCIDESSMVNKWLWDCLNYYEKPIILFGDHGQLRPIGDDPYLMDNPDFILEKIERTDHLDILDLAYEARMGSDLPRYNESSDNASIFAKGSIMSFVKSKESVDNNWQFLCGFNRTRHLINYWQRQFKFDKPEKDEWLLEGEKVICLGTYKNEGLFNGQQLTVEEIIKFEEYEARVKFAEISGYHTIDKYQFGNSKKKQWHPEDRLFDYGYCITVHKSQGSEWENVCILDEQCDLWDKKNWRYTAITRAKDKLIYGY